MCYLSMVVVNPVYDVTQKHAPGSVACAAWSDCEGVTVTAIELDGLTKRFGEVVAVDGLDLTVEEGEIFGFLGPNGAGKSTTIDILLDFIRPTSGQVTVLGHDAQAESLAVRRKTGVLPDGYHVYDRLTGRQHLAFAIDIKETDDDPMEMLERVGIADAADRKAGGYSKGMKQRLVLGIALLGDPDLLILDEPSTGLDPNGAREIREIIREESDRGTTVFFSSHVMEQVEAICDRVAIINRGTLVAVDSVEGLRSTTDTGEILHLQVATLSESVVSDIATVAGVEQAAIDDGRVRVTLGDRSKFQVLEDIDDIVAIEDFSVTTSSLSDLFIQYTSDEQEVRI